MNFNLNFHLLFPKKQNSEQTFEDSYFLFSINDTNNKRPIFVNRENPDIGKIEFSVQEEQAIGEEVGMLLAHDEDRTPPFNEVSNNFDTSILLFEDWLRDHIIYVK